MWLPPSPLIVGSLSTLSVPMKESVVPPSQRSPSIRRWQERILARVAIGVALALGFAVLLLHSIYGADARFAALLLLPVALSSGLLAQSKRLGYHSKARAVAGLGTAGATILTTAGPEAYPAALLLSLSVTVWTGLLLGRLWGALAAVGFLGGSFIGQALQMHLGTGAVAQSWGAWGTSAASFVVVAGICVWWADYGIGRIQRALVQRDDLIKLVREETEERIAQLEKQQSLERQLRQSQKMEALGTLAGGIAHDFNNLLLVIASGSQSAADADEEELSEILQEIREAAGRGSALTQQLLAFGRRKINERGILSLNHEVANSIQLIRRLIPTNVNLIFEPDEQVRTIEATSVDIDQVIMNLCINARDAMPDGGTIKIRTEVHQEPGHRSRDAVIVVSDSGKGMSLEEQERAFEPFFTTKRTGAGTGLGLSVVHSIVRNHKGFLKIDSRLGKGSEFRVHLPHIEHDIPTPAPVSTHVASRASERLLLVDDDAAVRKGVARVLRRSGYEVLIAEDGLAALELYRQSENPIALVITDAVMPNMGGRDLCVELAKLNPNQPCLVCSGYDAGTLEEGFFEENGREFLAKPFDNEQLLARVRALLELRSISERPPSIKAESWNELH